MLLSLSHPTAVFAMAGAPPASPEIQKPRATSDRPVYAQAWANSPYYTPLRRTDLRFSQFLDDVQTHAADPQVVSRAQQITQGMSSEWDKLVAIHNWVTTHISYGSVPGSTSAANPDAVVAQYQDDDAIYVLYYKLATCDGYSALTASLLRAVGIPAVMVTGTYTPSGNVTQSPFQGSSVDCDHEWNIAYVDGRWVYLDVTFDAAEKGTRYLGPDPSTFAIDHRQCSTSSTR